MPLFLHGASSKQSHGSSMDLEGRANVGRPFVVEHLKRDVHLCNERWNNEITNASSCLLRSVFREERLRVSCEQKA